MGISATSFYLFHLKYAYWEKISRFGCEVEKKYTGGSKIMLNNYFIFSKILS